MAEVQGGGRIRAEARVEAGGLAATSFGYQARGMVIRMGSWRRCTEWRQILEVRPTGLGTSWPREMEGEQSGVGFVGKTGGMTSETSKEAWQVWELGITPDLGMLGTLCWELWSGAAWPSARLLSLGQARRHAVRGGTLPGQRERCALPAPGPASGEEAMGIGEFRELPTPTSQPLVSGVALGKVPKKRPEAKRPGPGVRRASRRGRGFRGAGVNDPPPR